MLKSPERPGNNKSNEIIYGKIVRIGEMEDTEEILIHSGVKFMLPEILKRDLGLENLKWQYVQGSSRSMLFAGGEREDFYIDEGALAIIGMTERNPDSGYGDVEITGINRNNRIISARYSFQHHNQSYLLNKFNISLPIEESETIINNSSKHILEELTTAIPTSQDYPLYTAGLITQVMCNKARTGHRTYPQNSRAFTFNLDKNQSVTFGKIQNNLEEQVLESKFKELGYYTYKIHNVITVGLDPQIAHKRNLEPWKSIILRKLPNPY